MRIFSFQKISQTKNENFFRYWWTSINCLNYLEKNYFKWNKKWFISGSINLAYIFPGQNVLKPFWKRLLPSSSENVSKTSSRNLDQGENIRETFDQSFSSVLKKSWGRLQDIFKTSCKDIFKTSKRRLCKMSSKRNR